ncbi:MAG TPA: protein phosphatase 2C domain-containing protein [Lacunisphaera sp.]|nr:protein phosphatase 2C domain-containing protein [Lacunisphaera sp.]
MKLRFFAQSDIGRVRPENEDSFLSNETQQLYAVADGIGGLPSGAQASQMAVSVLEKLFQKIPAGQKPDYRHILGEINRQVFILGRVLSPQFGIGCTLTFAHLTGVKLHIGHVGDSSALRLRAKVLEQLTSDHTVENEMKERIARGEAMTMLLENRNALTRCIGQPPPLEAEVLTHTVLPHDRYLLATDGITRFLTANEIRDILQAVEEPKEAAAKLIDTANARGGLDNATAVVLFFD